MRLMLLRHAKAEKGSSGMGDPDRALNPRSRKDASKIGAYLARHALMPERVIVSSARRTRETWERLATALTAPPPADFDARLYNAGPEVILDVIKETGRATRTLL